MTKTKALRIYVPESVQEETRNYIKRILLGIGDGFTAYHGDGGWVNDDNEIIEENVKIYECVSDVKNPEGHLKSLAAAVKHKSDEDAVFWEIRPVEMKGME